MSKKEEDKFVTLSIRFDAPIYDQLKKLAKEEGRSIGGQARIFIAQGLNENRQETEI